MADDKRTVDYSAQGPAARRPVSDGTLMQTAGQRMMASGLGGLASAAQRGGQAAATRAAYTAIGEENAENIRNRFYQKEMKQVKKLRIDPILDRVKQAENAWQNASALKVRTIQSVVNGPEAIAENEQLQQATAQETPAQAITTGSKESPKTEMMPGTPQKQPNQLTTGPTIGAVSVEEALSVLNPENPDPTMAINATTPEGQAILDRHTNAFWQIYSDANMELMDIFSEYAGNPFMDNAMRGLTQETMNQAGFGVTGEKTPDQQAAARQLFDDDNDERENKRLQRDQILKENARLAKDSRKSEGMTQAAGGRARGAGLYKQGDTMEKSEAEYLLQREEEAIKRKRDKGDGQWRFAEVVIDNPGIRTLASEIRDESKYKQYVAEELAAPRNALLQEHMADSVAFAAKYASTLGEAQATVGAEPTGSSTVQYFVDQIARTGPHGGRALGNALVQRLEDISTWQPSLKKKIENELSVLRARKQADGTWTDKHAMMYAANPVGLYVGLNTPAEVNYWSFQAKQKRAELLGQRQDAGGQQGGGSAASQPAGPPALQPTPEELKQFHARQAKTPTKGRARLQLPRGKRNAAVPTKPLRVESNESLLTVDIYKMNLEQLKDTEAQMASALNAPNLSDADRLDLTGRLKEVQGLYSGPVDKEIARVGRNVTAVGNYISAGLDAVGDIMEDNRAERVEKSRKLLTVPEATGGSTIGSPEDASRK
jgi:hypothetical protein